MILNNATTLTSPNFTLRWGKPDERGSPIMEYIVWRQVIFGNGTKDIWGSSTVSSSNQSMSYLLSWGTSYRFLCDSSERPGQDKWDSKEFYCDKWYVCQETNRHAYIVKRV